MLSSILATLPVLAAQDPAPVVRPREDIPRVPPGVERPELDGRLDEDFWGHALRLTSFSQTLPTAGGTPSESTEVLLAYDRDNLYVGLLCWDDDAEAIRATQMEWDANLDPDDRVELIFDTFNDGRNGFWFQLGAAGSQGDALVSGNGTSFNKRWDGIWYGAARVTNEGWFGEIRIPFATVSFDPQNPRWGFNVRRHVRRWTEEIRWSSPDPRFRFFDVSQAGKLDGFGGMKQGIGLDLVPFFVGNYTNLDGESEHWLGDAGMDAFYRISPSTKLSLSYNTDFAQTEVDTRQVNLSRFPLLFPEKRKFFLEDSGVFDFGFGGGNHPDPFFSRRIGLDPEGNEVPLLWNAKLTTTDEGYRLGLLDSQTEATETVGDRNLFVGRYSKNILEQSGVGVIFTHGDPSGPSASSTAGADLQLRTDSFLGDRRLVFSSYVIGTDSPETSGDNLAYAALLEYPNDEIQASAGYLTVERNFDPALGFVRRRAIRQYDARFAYQPRLGTSIRRLIFQLQPRWITNTSGNTLRKQLQITPFGIELESGEEFELSVTPVHDVVQEDFDIQDPVTIPAGAYDFVRVSADLETSDRRELDARLRVETGTYFGGERTDYSASLGWRASRFVELGCSYALNDVDLEDGSFDVNIASLQLDLHLNPQASWSNYFQWDDVSENLGLNSRMRYIVAPGRDVFLVLNQGWTTFDEGVAPVSTDLRFKVGYTFRF